MVLLKFFSRRLNLTNVNRRTSCISLGWYFDPTACTGCTKKVPWAAVCSRGFSMSLPRAQIEIRKQEEVPATSTEKAKRAAKDTTYAFVIVAGIACMGFVFYILYRELLSKAGPTQVFGDALEKCRNHQQLSVALGAPIEGYGETNSRGRRRHVSHLAYIDAHGRSAMRMKFYVKGSSGRTGTVQVDSVISRGKIGYRYIIAYLDTYPRRTIIVMDERSIYDTNEMEHDSPEL